MIALPAALSLSCSSFYDYSGNTIACKPACPSGSYQGENKGLAPNRHTFSGEEHTCDLGWNNSGRTLCCKRDHYILNYNGTDTCQRCMGYVYANGKLCCPGSTYADFTAGSAGVCRPMGSGNCSTITMRSLFRVCCPSGQYYHLELEQCASPSSQNCDPIEKVCCRMGKKVEYLDKDFVCVSRCNWADSNAFYCQKRYCNI